MPSEKIITPHSEIEIDRDRDAYGPTNERLDKVRCTLFGDLCVQSWTAFFVWEKVLGEYEFRQFVEIGAGFGGTSLYFLLWAKQVGGDYFGYERWRRRARAHVNSRLKQLTGLKDHIRYADVFSDPTAREIRDVLRRSGRSVLFCDGGDKVHEFRTFAPALKPGDIVAAHDWPRAIRREWISETLDDHDFEQIAVDECGQIETHTVWFQRHER